MKYFYQLYIGIISGIDTAKANAIYASDAFK